MKAVRPRLALTPSGHLTLNQARVALANALFAMCHGVPLTLRLDDLNPARSRPAFAEAMARDLAWLGVIWETITRQSDDPSRYLTAIEPLKASGRLYPCFETEVELRAKAEQRRRRGRADVYDRAMLTLTEAQRAAAEAGGKRPYWRFRLSDAEPRWRDLVLGQRSVKLPAVSDPVLIGRDGTVAPTLATVIDDLAMGVTHVIRGEENVADTGIYLDLARALAPSGEPPAMAGIPALEAGSGRKPGSRPVREARSDGILPAAICAWLIGLEPSAEPPAASLESLAEGFSLRQMRVVPKPEHLLALNRRCLAETSVAAVRAFLPEDANEAFWLAIRDGIDLAADAAHWWAVVDGEIMPVLTPDGSALSRRALSCLPDEPWTDATWDTWLARLSDPNAAATLYPLLTGEAHEGPSPRALLPLIGRDRVLVRLRRACE